MVKLTVLYGQPESPEAFESYYAATHMPLARAIPKVVRIETARGIANPEGGAAPYYRIADLWFPDMDTLDAAMNSEYGKAAAADIANFATGGATLLISDID